MGDGSKTRWRFGVADMLALVAAVAAWLGLYPWLRSVQPMFDPITLAILLSGVLALLLAAFMGRGQSKRLVAGCLLLAACCAFALVRVCLKTYQ